MFTGLVKEAAEILAFERISENLWKFSVLSKLPEASSWPIGASIAFNGVCLTLVDSRLSPDLGQELAFEVSSETINRSNFLDLKSGMKIHLEPSLRVGDELGGHWVLGHVDGIGAISKIEDHQDCRVLHVNLSGAQRSLIAPCLVEKGSIAIDGVSLTINSLRDSADTTEFSVMLIPHTLKVTHFSEAREGQRVNLEGDILAKFSRRQGAMKSLEGSVR